MSFMNYFADPWLYTMDPKGSADPTGLDYRQILFQTDWTQPGIAFKIALICGSLFL